MIYDFHLSMYQQCLKSQVKKHCFTVVGVFKVDILAQSLFVTMHQKLFYKLDDL